MRRLRAVDVERVLERVPLFVRDYMQVVGPDIRIAGGFLRAVIQSEDVKDLDLFVSDKAKVPVFVEALRGVFGSVRSTENAVTIRHSELDFPIQIIHRWTFADAISMLQSFDFTVASACIWYEDGVWQSMCANSYYRDLRAKALVYTFPKRDEEPGGSFHRMLKFGARGYHATRETQAGVIARLMGGVTPATLGEAQALLPADADAEAVRAGAIYGLLKEAY